LITFRSDSVSPVLASLFLTQESLAQVFPVVVRPVLELLA